MKKLIFALLMGSALVASAAEYKLTTFFGSGVTNVSINMSCTNAVGQSGTTFTFTPTSTNNIIYYTGDGVYRYPLSSTSVVATVVSGTTYWTNTVVNTNVLNGRPFGLSKIAALSDGGVAPASLYLSMVGTNAGQNSAITFNFAGALDDQTVATGTTYSYFTFAATGNGTTAVNIITNLPSTWQCMRYIKLISIVGTTNTGGYLSLNRMGVAQFTDY